MVVAGGLLVHFRQQSLVSPDKKSSAEEDTASEIPTPAKQGPFPKMVVQGALTHDFGTMELGGEGEHTFTIRNEGQAPLAMVARKEDHTCQCTLGTLGKSGLQPGEETTITMKWGIKNPLTQFTHSAKVRTNDPENTTAIFRVQGLVGLRLVVTPEGDIPINSLLEGQPTVRKLAIHSELLDSFEITKLQLSNPELMEAKSRPLTEEEVKQLSQPDPAAVAAAAMARKQMAEASGQPGTENLDVHAGHDHAKDQPKEEESIAGKKPPAKCGYEIEVSFLPGFAVGKLRESLVIHTNVKERPDVRVNFGGFRTGPVQILPTAGVIWSAEEALLKLGRFPASEGKKLRLMIFVTKGDQDFKIEEATIDPPVLKYELVKDAKFKGAGREKFDLLLEVPAGAAPVSLGAQNRGLIKFVTNLPNAKEIKLEIEMASFKK